MADGGVTVEGEEDVSFLTQLTHKSFGLTTLHTHKKQAIIRFKAVKEISPTPCRLVLNSQAHLTVQFDVLCKCGVDLCEGAAESAAGDVDQILKGVHVIVLHKVLTVL